VLHRERHQGLPCQNPSACHEADKAAEQADALLAPGGAVAEIVAGALAAHAEDIDDRALLAAEQRGLLIGADEVRLRVEAIHRPSTNHSAGYKPYCLGCWEAGGEDGAPSWPCPTIAALANKRGPA
jgi:hypothetical protein